MKTPTFRHLNSSIGRRFLGTASLGGLLAVCAQVQAICVTNAADLQAALAAAEGSTSKTTIEIASGTYQPSAGPLEFNSHITGQGQLDISGGFSSDCSTRIENPELTILDVSASSNRNEGVLSLDSIGGISVRYLTLQGSTGGYAMSGVIAGGAGSIIMDYNIIHHVTGSGAIAAEILGSATGDIHVDGNLIAGNTGSEGEAAAGFVDNEGTGANYLTNNTVADNTNTLGSSGGIEVTAAAVLTNNIFWGNTAPDLIVQNGNMVLVNNDYGVAFGITPSAGNTGNVNVDPQFVSSTDFDLLPTSSLICQGTTNPAGGLPSIDIEGNPRTINGAVDMGAYERGDEIFGDSFED